MRYLCPMLPNRRLKQALAERGISQQEAAAKVGINPTYLCHLLAGDRRPSALLAIALCKLVDGAVDPMDLHLGRENAHRARGAA